MEVKILVVGRKKVGKTALVDRLTKKTFHPNTRITLGVEHVTYNTIVDGAPVIAYVWDVQGQEQHGTMLPVYYRGAHAMICVFNLDNADTDPSKHVALSWKKDVDSRVSDIPAVLVGNKCDIGPSLLGDEDHKAFLVENKFVAYVETSAKDNIRVVDAFQAAIREAVAIKKATEPPVEAKPVKGVGITVKPTPLRQDRGGGCC